MFSSPLLHLQMFSSYVVEARPKGNTHHAACSDHHHPAGLLSAMGFPGFSYKFINTFWETTVCLTNERQLTLISASIHQPKVAVLHFQRSIRACKPWKVLRPNMARWWWDMMGVGTSSSWSWWSECRTMSWMSTVLKWTKSTEHWMKLSL